MLARLHELPAAREMLPFIRLFYGQPSRYLFEDEQGIAHTIWQGEGGEQGDALMPALFALGIDHALREAAQLLLADELLLAYLDEL